MNKFVKLSMALLVAGTYGLQAAGHMDLVNVDFDNHPALQRRLSTDPIARQPITEEEKLAYENAMRRSRIVYSDSNQINPEDLDFLGQKINDSEGQALNRYYSKQQYQQDLAVANRLQNLSPQERVDIVKAVEAEKAINRVRARYTAGQLRAQEAKQREADLAREYGFGREATAQEIRQGEEALAAIDAVEKVDEAARKKFPQLYNNDEGPTY